MKHVTKVSSEGQITIPEEIRECLGIEPDDTVELSYEDGQVVLRSADCSPSKSSKASFHRSG